MVKMISRRDFLKRSSTLAAAGIGGCGLLLKGCAKAKDFDLIIKNGLIVDGTGQRAFEADVAVAGDLIAQVGRIPAHRGTSVLEARGLIVSPGFIDVHQHTDVELLVNPKAESAVRQGITTLLTGNCGSSAFPVADATLEENRAALREEFGLELDWRDAKGWLTKLERSRPAVNYSSLVGHGEVRAAAMGLSDRPPAAEEMARMIEIVEGAMREGAFGLSSGLEYTPGSFAKPDELAELCRVVSRHRGVYATHMRDEGDGVLESLDECIAAARETGCSLQISHLKMAYPRNWEKVDAALAKIDEAKKAGVDINADRYPYIAASTGLSIVFPTWAREGRTEDFLARLEDPRLEERLRQVLAEHEEKLGSWAKIVISSVFNKENKWLEGKSVLEAAAAAGKDTFRFMRDLLVAEKGRASMVEFIMDEVGLPRILGHPLIGVGSDGSALAAYGPLGQGKPHPRNYGTFARALGKYVREEKVAPLEEMVRKVTSLPARKFGFERRGILAPGYFADLVVFDPHTVADRATWSDPHRYPAGIPHVLVNGRAVVRDGEHTGDLPGRILRKLA